MRFSTISAAAAMAFLPALAQAKGCRVEISDSNQKVVGSGCAAIGRTTTIKDNRGGSWGISANSFCGVSAVQQTPPFPDGWSVRKTGNC